VNWFYPIQDSNNTCCCKHGHGPYGSTQAWTFLTAAASINMSRRILHIGFSICCKTAFNFPPPPVYYSCWLMKTGKDADREGNSHRISTT